MNINSYKFLLTRRGRNAETGRKLCACLSASLLCHTYFHLLSFHFFFHFSLPHKNSHFLSSSYTYAICMPFTLFWLTVDFTPLSDSLENVTRFFNCSYFAFRELRPPLKVCCHVLCCILALLDLVISLVFASKSPILIFVYMLYTELGLNSTVLFSIIYLTWQDIKKKVMWCFSVIFSVLFTFLQCFHI